MIRRIMAWLVKRFVSVKRLFGRKNANCPVAVPQQASVAPVAPTETPAGEMETPIVTAGDNDKTSKLFDEVLNDCCLQERRIFRIFCRPLGLKGSDVICEVTKKYKTGTKLTRTNGQKYEIYRVKKTKRTRVEAAGPMPLWRAVA